MFEGVMIEFFSKFDENYKSQDLRSSMKLKQEKNKENHIKTYHNHILIITSDKEKMLSGERRKSTHYVQRIKEKNYCILVIILVIKVTQARRLWSDIYKILKGKSESLSKIILQK